MIQKHRSGCVWLDGRTYWFRAGKNSKPIKLGSTAEFTTKTAARKAAQRHVIEANDPKSGMTAVLNAAIERYRNEELPTLRRCTSRVYECWLDNYIIPKWGRVAIRSIEAYAVQKWLESLDISGKSRAEIRSIMKRLIKRSMFWGIQAQGPNPIELVEVRDTRRKSKPRLMTVEEFTLLVAALREPFRTMACMSLCHGLRVSELLGLKWSDVNWFGKSLSIQRSIVCQIVEATKSEASQADLPLEEEEIVMLRGHRTRTEFTADTDYIFASPHSGGLKPYHYTAVLWKLHLACEAAGIEKIGTHTFRHTARAWAGQAGINLSVMKDMLRHADIRTTMNVYGGTVKAELRDAHSKVVRMASS